MTLREEILNLAESTANKRIEDTFSDLFDKYARKYEKRNNLKERLKWWEFFDSDYPEVHQWEKHCETIARKAGKIKQWEEYYKEMCDDL